MKTGNKEYIRRVYKLDQHYKSNDRIKEYIFLENQNILRDNILKERIRIEKDNGFHDRSRFFEYWLYIRNDSNWKRCSKTGLAKTKKKYVFEGNVSEFINLNTKNEKGKDWENPKHFVLVQFSDDTKNVVIDLFKNFYPVSQNLINLFIKEHEFYYKKEKELMH